MRKKEKEFDTCKAWVPQLVNDNVSYVVHLSVNIFQTANLKIWKIMP